MVKPLCSFQFPSCSAGFLGRSKSGPPQYLRMTLSIIENDVILHHVCGKRKLQKNSRLLTREFRIVTRQITCLPQIRSNNK